MILLCAFSLYAKINYLIYKLKTYLFFENIYKFYARKFGEDINDLLDSLI